jgi:signal transduction histidine kinase
MKTLFDALIRSSTYVRAHPQILFALMLLILLPALFVYTGNQFLEVGKANQDKIGKDSLGRMHDALASLFYGTNGDSERTFTELSRIQRNNNDLIAYAIVKHQDQDFVYVHSSDDSLASTSISDPSLYVHTSLRTDESLIFEFYDGDIRYWAGYRTLKHPDTGLYFIYTLFSLEKIDNVLTSREKSAYFSLIYVYGFLIALAYWHIRLTDYRYLYIKEQKTNQMKDLFTHMIAHELRSPLTAIKGYANLLSEKVTTSEQKVHVERISVSAERLITIVNDLLDVARIQSGKLFLEKSVTDIVPLIQNVLHDQEVIAQQKGITLTTEGMDTPSEVMIDGKRFTQALVNLVSNAIKYGGKGAIVVSLADKHAYTELRVKDTGVGIEASEQQKLFAPFFRTKDADLSEVTGTGLGMWISKQLIELQGGTVAVESIKGVGTHVVVKLPKELRI